jgi:hypothetical protein
MVSEENNTPGLAQLTELQGYTMRRHRLSRHTQPYGRRKAMFMQTVCLMMTYQGECGFVNMLRYRLRNTDGAGHAIQDSEPMFQLV